MPIAENSVVKTFVDMNLSIMLLNGEQVVVIRHKNLFPTGGYLLDTHFYRKIQGQWEWTIKSSLAYRADGSLRSSNVTNNSKLKWTPFKVPIDDNTKTEIELAEKLITTSK